MMALQLLLLAAAQFLAERPVFRPIEPGLDIAHVRKAAGPQSIHVVRVRLGRPGWRFAAGLGDGRVYGLSTTPGIAKAAGAALDARPLAAINGDFYAIARGDYQGDPVGLHVGEGEVVSAPVGRACVWFDDAGRPHLGRVESRFRVAWPGGGETPLGLNGPRGDGEAVLFTPSMAHNPKDVSRPRFGTRTTGGRELVLQPAGAGDWLPLRAGATYRAKVAAVREGGNSPLAKTSVVLSIGPALLERVPAVAVGAVVTIRRETSPELGSARTAIGGGERLLDAGRVVADGKSRERHPRSVIGWNREHLYLVVVGGRAPGVAVGMTYRELAGLASSLGCTEALNLDGGGSSTLWAGGAVRNTPSDGAVRPVANALVLLEAEPAVGPARSPAAPVDKLSPAK